MRTFYVTYMLNGECIRTTNIILLQDEKATVATFNARLKALGGLAKEVLSWSLVER